jgi:tetratricopeptide (TPR) repeat protein
VAEAIEAVYAHDLEPHVLALGLHYHAAEMWPQAFEHLRRAAGRAFAQSAYRESAACFERALEAASHLPRTADTLDQVLDLQIQLRSALWPLAEFERVAQCLGEANRLATLLGDRGRLARTAASTSVLRWILGDAPAACRLAQTARDMAVTLEDGPLQGIANYYLGLPRYLLGEYHDAEAVWLENVRRLAGAQELERIGATSTLVVSAAWLVLPLAERGAFARGLKHGGMALQRADAGQDFYGIVTAAYCLAYLHCLRGQFATAIPLLERALVISREREFSVWLPPVAGYLGHAYAQRGRVGEGLPLFEEAIEVFETTRAWPFRALITTHRGDACLGAAQGELARTFAREALMQAREHGERGYEAWALRLLRAVAAHSDGTDTIEAEHRYRAALGLAGELGMRPLGAHCHLGLGKLYRRTGETEQAQAHLATAATLYRKMDMTYWLEKVETELRK